MKILCAGPTSLDERVLQAMGESRTNPDLDPEYTRYHRGVEAKISDLLKTKCPSIFMLGEGILGLEAAVCSLMERGERVLVIYNGFFGQGFGDYVKNFGGEAVFFQGDFERGIQLDKLGDFLEKDHDFALATMVHCETPSGITNDIQGICDLLNDYGILSIVDAVSSLGGEDIDFDRVGVDILLAGSQKCLSAPTGLSILTLSHRAIEKMQKRKTPIPSYYMNLLNYLASVDGFDFPYTMCENLIYAIDEAIDQARAKDSIGLHRAYAENTRQVFQACGFALYPKDSYSNTVTAVRMPQGIEAERLLEEMRKRDILLSKGVGFMAEKVFRIGHMGHNIGRENFAQMYQALDASFEALGLDRPGLYECFLTTDIGKAID